MKRRDFLKVALGTASGVYLSTSPFHLLFSRDRKERETAWKEITEKWKFTSCNLCPAGCGLACRVVNGKVVKTEGNPLHPLNRGSLCPKGAAAVQLLYHPNRLRHPLLKKGKNFERISWEEAKYLVARQLKKVEKSPESLLLFKKEGYALSDRLVEYFMKWLGSPNVVNLSSSSALESALELTQKWAGTPAYDFKQARYVLSFGTDLFGEFRNPMLAMKGYLSLRERKGKIIQVEPRLSQTGSRSDRFIAINPGTEGAFALGIAHILVKQELYDKSFMEKFTYGFESFVDKQGKRHRGWKRFLLEEYSPGIVSEITGVPSEKIVKVAQEFGLNKPSLAIIDEGSNKGTNAVWNAIAVHSLNALVGAIDAPGGFLFQQEVPFSSLPELKNNIVKDRVDKSEKELSFTQGAPVALLKSLLWGKPYPIKVAFFYHANPVFSLSENEKWEQAIKNIPFKVGFSFFLDETSSLCDLVIPELTPFEKWDIVASPSVGVPIAGMVQPVVKPRGKAISNAHFLLKVLKKLNEKRLSFQDDKEMVKFAMEGVYRARRGAVFSPSFESNFVEKVEEGGFWFPQYKDYSSFYLALKKAGGWADPRYPYKRWGQVLRTGTGKFEFFLTSLQEKMLDTSSRQGVSVAQVLAKWGLEAEEEEVLYPHFEKPKFEGEEADFPFTLLPFAVLPILSTPDANLPFLQELYGREVYSRWDSYIEIHPYIARKRGIRDGDRIKLKSSKGEMIVRARVWRGVGEDVVAIGMGQGHRVLAPFAQSRGENPRQLLFSYPENLSGSFSLLTTRVKVERV